MYKSLIMIFFFTVSVHTFADDAAKPASPYSKTALVKIAMSAGPPSISLNATIVDYDGTILREGTNQWVCNTGGDPQRINPACLDKVWVAWNDRFMAGKSNDIENQPLGQAYMLKGDVPVDNDVPFAEGRFKSDYIGSICGALVRHVSKH